MRPDYLPLAIAHLSALLLPATASAKTTALSGLALGLGVQIPVECAVYVLAMGWIGGARGSAQLKGVLASSFGKMYKVGRCMLAYHNSRLSKSLTCFPLWRGFPPGDAGDSPCRDRDRPEAARARILAPVWGQRPVPDWLCGHDDAQDEEVPSDQEGWRG